MKTALPCKSARATRSVSVRASAQEPLLVRVARGEEAERTPVWLMRQAGRYMAEFRAFSDKFGFRERSENAEIAIELSMQPYRAFKTDGVIMFSDILTPLPALGIEFDVVKGKGPIIPTPVRTTADVKRLATMDDPASRLPFIEEILSTLRKEAPDAAVLGFIGTPWTLAAYAMEGKADKHCMKTKTIMLRQPEVLHAFLEHLTVALIEYVAYQIESGAQVVQLFDSWAHHLSPEQFMEFSYPYSERIIKAVRARYPNVPLIFHANGGTGKLELMHDSAADVLGTDWATTMGQAREILGAKRVIQGNVDPMVLFGTEEVIRREVNRCLVQGGPQHHILNVGHGVAQGTPEENVKLFVQLARESAALRKQPAVAGARN